MPVKRNSYEKKQNELHFFFTSRRADPLRVSEFQLTNYQADVMTPGVIVKIFNNCEAWHQLIRMDLSVSELKQEASCSPSVNL